MEADHPERHGFSLRYQNGWAVLIVPPESKRPRPVYTDDVAARMKLLNIPPVPARTIRDIIEKGSGRPEALVEWPSGAQLSAWVEVSVSEDGMEARARVGPARPGGAPLDRDIIHAALDRAGVTKGVLQGAVKALIQGEGVHEEYVIAKGRPAEAGIAEMTECLFITDRGRPWKELSGGRIDLKELNFIQNRKAGDLLARRIPAVEPCDGFDVYGQVIPADPVPPTTPITAGEGVMEIEGGLEAAVDGNVRLDDGVIFIEPSVTVENVDYSTGNIDFDGSVSIEGTVADGFAVKASGDIQVGKTVGRARLETERNLVLQAGIVGDGEGTCIVKENLFAKFLESAVVRVNGDVVVSEAVLHSNIEVDGSLYLTEGRGEMTGGVAAVGGSMECKRIGSLYAGSTRLYIGCPPAYLNDYQKMGGEIKKIRDERDELERQLDYLKSRAGTDPRQLDNLENGIGKRIKMLKDGAAELSALKAELRAADGTQLTVRDRVYQGSFISFGIEEYAIGDKGLERVVLRRENGQTTMHGYSPRGGDAEGA
jgi:uncharacterized protein (DUF342 family)